MSRNTAIFSVDMYISKRYSSVSLESRDAYMCLCAFVSGGGYIKSPEFVLKGRGLDEDCLDELEDAGLIIRVDEECFLVDFWLVNRRDAKFIKMLESTDAWQNGLIGFKGEEFRSKFIKVDGVVRTSDTPSAYQVCSKNASSGHSVGLNATQCNAFPTHDNATSSFNATVDVTSFADGSEPGVHPDSYDCICDWCGATASCSKNEDGTFVVYCPNCETHIFGDLAPEILSSDIVF